MSLYDNDDNRLIKESRQSVWYQFASPFRYVISIIIVICLIIAIWYLLSPSTPNSSYSKAGLPLIETEESPFKVKAEAQDIVGVNHQDKLVYGRLRDDETPQAVEHILPAPEEPLAQLEEPPSTLKMIREYIPEDVALEEIKEATETPSLDSIQNHLSIADLIAEQSYDNVPEPKDEENKGNIFIQLGSLTSYNLAESEWSRLVNNNKDLLSDQKPIIQKVDLGEDQGIYFRLRTGPFSSNEQAKKACSALKERKVDCLVIQ